nr:7-carboxy-7-deazaguanine synthase QueE [Kofleriaceae bacterium]
MALRISELFASIQGEGPSVGVPSVFVRLAECNLACTWCDTKYTWDWEHYDREREVREVAVDDVAEEVVELAGAGARTLVVTGGEPMLQQFELVPLLVKLRAFGFRVEVETSGTITPEPAIAAVVDQWNVSPKLASSGNKRTARLRAAPLGWFAAAPNAGWKLVATSEADLAEIDDLVATYAVPAARVTVMPEGTDAATLAERARWLVPACVQRGWRFGTRMHVVLWGSERGR